MNDGLINKHISFCAVGPKDIFFQDDGARSDRFSPYFGNTGFFYVRNNYKTQYLMQVGEGVVVVVVVVVLLLL